MVAVAGSEIVLCHSNVDFVGWLRVDTVALYTRLEVRQAPSSGNRAFSGSCIRVLFIYLYRLPFKTEALWLGSATRKKNTNTDTIINYTMNKHEK